MAPVPGVRQIPGGKPAVNYLRVPGETHRYGSVVVRFQQGQKPRQGIILKIVFQNKGLVGLHQLGRGIVQDVHGRHAQPDLFLPAAKAQVIKQNLFDGILGQHGHFQGLRNFLRDGAFSAGRHTGNQNAVHTTFPLKDCPDIPRVFSR